MHKRSLVGTVRQSRTRAAACFALGSMSLPTSAGAQDAFPAGPARDTVFVVCTQCHPLTRILQSDLNAAEWEFLLYDMIARGATLYEREVGIIKDYLVDNFANGER